MGKRNRELYEKKQEEKANRIIKSIFIALIVLAIIIMVGFAFNA